MERYDVDPYWDFLVPDEINNHFKIFLVNEGAIFPLERHFETQQLA